MRCYASTITVYMISAKLEYYSCMVDLLDCASNLQEAENTIMECPVNQMWLHGWLCSVLAEFMVMWRWQNVLRNKFLKWNLRMLLVMCCCQTSMLLLATGVSENVEQQRKERGVKKQLGHTWIEVNNEVHTFVVGDQDH